MRIWIQLFKVRAILFYLKTLQAVRRSLILAVLVFFTLQLMVLGFLGLVIISVWLLPNTDTVTRLYMLLGFFAFIFAVPVIALCVFLSERFWYRHSGAEQMLK